jgi:hypothetical protein
LTKRKKTFVFSDSVPGSVRRDEVSAELTVLRLICDTECQPTGVRAIVFIKTIQWQSGSLLVSEELEIVLRQRLPKMVHASLDTLLGVRGGIRLSALGKLLIAQKFGVHLRFEDNSLSRNSTKQCIDTKLTPFVEILVPVLARLIPFLCALRF